MNGWTNNAPSVVDQGALSMTDETAQPIAEEDTMIVVFFNKSSGHFLVNKLSEQGKKSDDTAAPGEYEGWSEYMEPSEFYKKLQEIFGV